MAELMQRTMDAWVCTTVVLSIVVSIGFFIRGLIEKKDGESFDDFIAWPLGIYGFCSICLFLIFIFISIISCISK